MNDAPRYRRISDDWRDKETRWEREERELGERELCHVTRFRAQRAPCVHGVTSRRDDDEASVTCISTYVTYTRNARGRAYDPCIRTRDYTRVYVHAAGDVLPHSW